MNKLFSIIIASAISLIIVFVGIIIATSINIALKTTSEPLGAFQVAHEVQGGTGTSTYAVGDLLYARGTSDLASIPIGTAGQALIVSGGLPVWGGASGGSNWQYSTNWASSLTTTSSVPIWLQTALYASSTARFTGAITGVGGFIGDLTGNADTATALDANGANCSAGNYPLGVDASGAVEDCTAIPAGSNWQFATANALIPTSTVGFIMNASSTIMGDFSVGSNTFFVDNDDGVYISDTNASPFLAITNKSDTTTYDPQITFRTGATPATRMTIWLDDSDSDKLKFSPSTATTYPPLIIGTTGKIEMNILDNDTEALQIKEATNSYLTFDTTDGDEKITVGKNIETGTIQVVDDSGLVILADMGITSASATSTANSLSIGLDGTAILTVYGESTGYLGNLQNGRVGIATTTPGYTLTVDGNTYCDGNTTTTNLAITALTTCTLKTDGVGHLYCGSDNDSGGFSTTTADYWGSQRAGTNISWSTGFNVDDSFLLNTYDTGTGLTLTYSTTTYATSTNIFSTNANFLTSLKVPQDTTLDETGEIGINTATSSLRYYDGSNVMVLSPIFEKSAWIASTTDDENNNSFDTATSTFVLWNPAKSVTLVGLFCKTDTGTVSVACGDGTNWTESIVCTSSGVEDDGSMTNNTFSMREDFACKIGSAASTPNKVTITAEVKYAND